MGTLHATLNEPVQTPRQLLVRIEADAARRRRKRRAKKTQTSPQCLHEPRAKVQGHPVRPRPWYYRGEYTPLVEYKPKNGSRIGN